jgi:hypothetical protein
VQHTGIRIQSRESGRKVRVGKASDQFHHIRQMVGGHAERDGPPMMNVDPGVLRQPVRDQIGKPFERSNIGLGKKKWRGSMAVTVRGFMNRGT